MQHDVVSPPAPRSLILVESRIHRLARYYKRVKKLPPTW
jgi:ribosomal protein S15P/S13E